MTDELDRIQDGRGLRVVVDADADRRRREDLDERIAGAVEATATDEP